MDKKETTIINGRYYDYKKNPFVLIPMILGILAVVISFAFTIMVVSSPGLFGDRGWGSYFIDYIILNVPGFIFYGGILFVAIALFLNERMKKCSLVVTDKRVFGRASFGKRVDLPLNQISSVGLGMLSSLSVATSSGVIKFWILENRDEIHKKLSDLLGEQQKPVMTNIVTSQSNADELGKYKNLLDSGIITQEEFDAKKKQLLGL